MDLRTLWTSALGEIELSISRANFITWFKNTAIESIDDHCAVISVPNGFAKEWIEKKCADTVLAALKNHELSYSKFIKMLKDKEFGLNRKMLATLAKDEPEAFDRVVTEVTK